MPRSRADQSVEFCQRYRMLSMAVRSSTVICSGATPMLTSRERQRPAQAQMSP